MCGRAGSGRSAAVIMRLTGAHRLGSTRGYAESFNVAPGNYVMTLVRRSVSESKEQAKDEGLTKEVVDHWGDKPAGDDLNDTIVVADDLPDDTEDVLEKPDSKDDGHDGDGEKEVVLEAMKWGLVPWFTKAEDVAQTGSQAINARSETVSQKAFFRHLVNRRRCVVVVDGFFEWKKFEVLGQPRRQAFFVLPNPNMGFEGAAEAPQPLLYLAALWDIWRAKDSQEKLVTCTILTTESTTEFAGIHDRMPVVLQPENVTKWLDTDTFKFDQLRPLLSPYKENGLSWYEVTDKVNSVKNRSAENIEPMALHKAKGIGRFFIKPKSVDGGVDMVDHVSQFEVPVKTKRPEEDDDVIVVPGRTLAPPNEVAPKKSPSKKKKIEQLPGQKSLTGFFK